MKQAKNSIRLAGLAGLALLLCCVASAGPTYSFVKIAGEWAFYEESDGFNSDLEVSVNPGRSNGLTRRTRTILTDDDLDMNLAMGSIVNLSSVDNGSGSVQSRTSSSNQAANPSGVVSKRSSLLNTGSDEDVKITSDSYPGASPYLVKTTLSNGFEDPDLKNGVLKTSKLQKGESNIPNGNAWGYWKDKNANQDIASPVPVPVPGSIILAAIGAGLVKLLHDRRVKR